MGFRDSNFSSRESSGSFGERRSFGGRDGGSRGGFRGGGNRGGFGGRRSFGPREMTKIICAKCGKEDQVPFKPREGSEVLCKDCYFKEKGIEPRSAPTSAPVAAPSGEVKEKKQESEDLELSEEAEFDDAEETEEKA
jgi:CxxC-x17-CxxC domain-containing protein